MSEENQPIIAELKKLRGFEGSPSEFWPAYLGGVARLVKADSGLLQILTPESNSQEESGGIWKTMSVWPADFLSGKFASTLMERACLVAGHASVDNSFIEKPGGSGASDRGVMLAVRLDFPEGQPVSVVVFYFPKVESVLRQEVLLMLELVADIPAAYQSSRSNRQAKEDVGQFAEALDLMVLLNEDVKYVKAAMTLCNEIAARYGCARVSLGWLEANYIRLQAISHMERFEKKMSVVQSLEAAMEEAFDQDEEVLYPRPSGNTTVVRDHENYARIEAVEYLVSLPIRLDGGPVGVLTCERSGTHFDESEIRGLRLFCDQAARRLLDLKHQDRWFGARFGEAVKKSITGFFGIENTFVKAIGVLIFLCLAFMIFGKLTYRVEANFILKTDDLLYMPSPYDGYIDEVFVQVGDNVAMGDLLLKLDGQELFLQESSAIADKSRYAREAEKARAVNALADMKIALAMKDQAASQLKMVRYYLENAAIKAPFSGIVVEGDLTKMLGAPVRKGDILFKLALIEKLYVEVDIDEKDVHELRGNESGEIAFVSRPNLKFPIRVDQIDPVAVTKESGNIFVLRSSFTEELKSWWRPGMSGIAKINVGKRSPLWIFTHRTVDFFRMMLWW